MVLLNSSSCNFDWQPNNFQFSNLRGDQGSLYDSFDINGVLVMFICNHCPYVKSVIGRIVEDCKILQENGLGIIAIMSNDVNDPKYGHEDSFDNMIKFSDIHQFSFPYVYDETQETGQIYDAVCTPDFFGFNSDNELQYRGRLESSQKELMPNAKKELLEAMLQVAKTGKGPKEQIPSIGCSIKWKT